MSGERREGGQGAPPHARAGPNPGPNPPSFRSYFFYKNAVYTLTQFWFNMWTGFSAQRLYDDWHQV